MIDDDPLVARAIARSLVEYAVDIETDPLAALARICAGERFDLVVCDWWMPRCGGNDVLVAIQEYFAGRTDQPNVIMTSGSDEVLDEGRFRGASVLLKPFRSQALQALVSTLIDARS